MDSQESKPRNIEDIFEDFSGRRTGLIHALTRDVEKFFSCCDPDKESLCLFGRPNESWEVTLPVDFLPSDIPDPLIGINLVRDRMDRKQWLSKVALHCDSWLLSVAFYNGALLNRTERKRLFSLINNLPTVLEIVTGNRLIKDSGSGNKSQGRTKRTGDGKVKSNQNSPEDKNNEDVQHKVLQDEEDEDDILCGICGGNDNGDEFWIDCDICEEWFHGKCVRITPAKAKRIKKYKCQYCNIKW